tara:strand:+ start:559 stop:954 length:396 start_codon:yes stop_codon:yes gene_type:complete
MTSLFNNMPDLKEIAFDDFYKLYPRKISRSNAEKSFKRLNKKDKVLAYEGIIKYNKFWEENKTEPQYIPYPSTWLNQKRWEDELIIKEVKTSKTNHDAEVLKFRKEQEELEQNAASQSEIQEALKGFLRKK